MKIYLNFLIFVLLIISVSGCSRPTPPPREAINIQPWGSMDLNISKDDTCFSIKQSMGNALLYKLEHTKANHQKEINILALSGGGSHGAYGIGLIEGWKDSKNMPKFDMVTGVSTGSILATFVFLGGDYIDYIANVYTHLQTKNIYYYNFLKLFGGSSLTNTQPLKDMLREGVTEELLKKVAQEYHKGRRLYMATTNIDAGKPVIWDMTAIAASDHPNKLQLYRDIIYASCALPSVFDPQYFEIKYKNKKYYQMHIDGGIYAHVFMIGLFENWKDVLNIQTKEKYGVNVYVIGNRKYRLLDTKQPLESDGILEILTQVATHSIDLIYDRSLYRLYKGCQKEGYNFYYTGIDDNITTHSFSHQFIPKDMKKLYEQGYKKGIGKIPWQRTIAQDELLYH